MASTPTPPPADTALTRYVLRLSCPDRKGIVHAVAEALLSVDGNIRENAQFGDVPTGRFCLRTVFESPRRFEEVTARLEPTMQLLGADHVIRPEADRPNLMVLVSKFDHCLLDLLYRWRCGELAVNIVAVVSNHETLRATAESAGVPYFHLPVTADTRPEQEAELDRLADELRVDLIVLARYMQVLSDDLCQRWNGRAINIHHSFLPGFKGAKPYHQAYERGVKLIGATAHFVTGDLDEGPIIEQGVERVDHSLDIQELIEIGRDVERTVLAKAVRYWAEDRILLLGHRTVVFR